MDLDKLLKIMNSEISFHEKGHIACNEPPTGPGTAYSPYLPGIRSAMIFASPVSPDGTDQMSPGRQDRGW